MHSSTSSSDKRPPEPGQVLRFIGMPVLAAFLILVAWEGYYRWAFGPLSAWVKIPNLKSEEGYRRVVATPEAHILGLGDSRFETSFDPARVVEGYGEPAHALNLAISSGNVVNQMETLAKLDCRNRLLVIETTPGTVAAWKGRIRKAPPFGSWYFAIESWLTHLCNSNLLIANGQPLFFYTLGLRKTVNIQQPDGWIKVVTRRPEHLIDDAVLRSWQKDLAAARIPPEKWVPPFEMALSELLSRGNRIVLVRNPILPALRAVEDKNYPDFDRIITQVAGRHGLKYFTRDQFDLQTGISYDGVHYGQRRAGDFSRQLGHLLN